MEHDPPLPPPPPRFTTLCCLCKVYERLGKSVISVCKKTQRGNRYILRLWKSPLFSQGMVFRLFWISTWCISYLSFSYFYSVYCCNSRHGNCTANLRVRRLVRRGLHGHYVCLKVNRVRVSTPQWHMPPFPNCPLPQTPHPSSLITKSYYSGKRFGNREMEH